MNNHSDELTHYGIPGMKWGQRRARYEYKYAYGQKPKNKYQKVARSVGGTKFAKNAILKNNKLTDQQRRTALKEHEILADEKAYNKAMKKASKTGSKVTYDVTTKKYTVETPKQKIKETKIKNSRYGKTNGQFVTEWALKNAATTVVTDIAATASTKLGAKKAAEMINIMGGSYMLGTTIGTVYGMATNYKPKKNKNR